MVGFGSMKSLLRRFGKSSGSKSAAAVDKKSEPSKKQPGNAMAMDSQTSDSLPAPDLVEKEFQFHGHEAGRVAIARIDPLSDDELQRLNKLLPWSAWTVDSHGRRFGNRHNEKKRNVPAEIPDYRILNLAERIELADATVLEVGCFEGLHTVALCQRAKHVVAVDSRIEHCVKTMVRCWAFNQTAHVELHDLEQGMPTRFSAGCDVLHHVGVLYHLSDPVGHLRDYLSQTRKMIMLDTHVAPEDKELDEYEGHRYFRFREHGRDAPFAGMVDHAKWLHLDDLVRLLKECGMTDVDVAEHRIERNGPRVLIYASRS